MYFHDYEGILNSKNMANIWVVYAFSTRTYFDVTSCNNLDSEKVDEDDGEQNKLQFFLEESKNKKYLKFPKKFYVL